MIIPQQFKKEGFRFIKVKPNKAPSELDWQKSNNYLYSEFEKFNQEIYGILCGCNNLLVVDFDTEEIQNDITPKLPETFTVKSAGKGLSHLYFIADEPQSFKVLDLAKNTLADIQGKGKQIIGPNSKLEDGRTYRIIKDIPLANIKLADLKKALEKWMNVEEKAIKESNGTETDPLCAKIKDNVKVPDLLVQYGINAYKNPTECPFHSSKGGRCFSYNNEVWHCFHCEKKGNVFHLVMEKEGLDFTQAKSYLAEKSGYDVAKETHTKTELDDDIPYKFLPEILNNPIPKPAWRIEDFVPESGVTYLAAQPGEGKTMLALFMAQCISSGRKFLGKSVIPGKVIYFDAENGEVCAYDRLKRIATGYDFSDEELENMAYSIFPNIRFDIKHPSYKVFNEFCLDFKPDVIIFDSLVRFMEGSENDSESCKMVFDYLRDWLKKNPKLSIIILHHLSKTHDGGMNALRGSSEIAASASSIIMLNRLSYAYKIDIKKSRYVDMTKKHEIYYNLVDSDGGLQFEIAEKQDLPNDSISRANEDFLNWIEEQKITSFKSKTCEDHLKTKGHSKNAIYQMIRTMLKEGILSKLSRGNYEIKDKVFTSSEEVKPELN